MPTRNYTINGEIGTEDQPGFFAFIIDDEESGRSVSFDSPEEMLEVAYAMMTIARGGQGVTHIRVRNKRREVVW